MRSDPLKTIKSLIALSTSPSPVLINKMEAIVNLFDIIFD